MSRISVFTRLLCLVAAVVIPLEPVSGAHKKKRILYLGDSMSMGAFGQTLDKEIREAGFELYTYVAGGATPYYWLSRYSTIKGPIGYWEKTPGQEVRRSVIKAVPKVESLLERFDPDVVIVQTGTNLYATLRSKRRSKENNVKEVEGLLNHMVEAATQGGRRCYWITPPEAHPGRYPTELQKELTEITKRVVSREAKVFDSSSVTKYTDPYPKNDGIHYGPTEARQWAAHVAKDFNQFMGIDLSESTPPEKPSSRSMVDDSDIPRAIPVKRPRPNLNQRVKDKPPVKAKPEPELPGTGTVEKPPVMEKPPVKKSKRPPVQYVKKALPIETKGIKWGELELELKLVSKSQLKSLKDVDYSYCFAVNEYEVLKVNSGNYPFPRIRIARVVMWANKVNQSVFDESIGSSPRGGWRLVPMSKYPRFENMQTVEDLPFAPQLPIYIVAFE